MKETELRIGNLVNYGDSELIIGINYFRDGDFNKLEPILLTEEWLIKFGFELLCRKSIGFKDTVFSMQKPSWSLMKLDKGWGVNFWQGNNLL